MAGCCVSSIPPVFGNYRINDNVINIHEVDMSQIQLDNQKRFLKSCKNLQVQLPQRPHGRVLGRYGMGMAKCSGTSRIFRG
jgi:hypothetical protein